jgi:hypothetical protein
MTTVKEKAMLRLIMGRIIYGHPVHILYIYPTEKDLVES